MSDRSLTENDPFAPSIDDAITSYVFTDEEVKEGNEEDQYFPGGTAEHEISLPNQAPNAAFLSQLQAAVKAAMDEERKEYQDLLRSAVRVTTNLAGTVSMQRVSVPVGQVIRICREKPLRGNAIISNYTAGSDIYVGLQPGIQVAGTDTVRIPGLATGSRLVIRTKMSLYAIASGSAAEVDIVEEFD